MYFFCVSISARVCQLLCSYRQLLPFLQEKFIKGKILYFSGTKGGRWVVKAGPLKKITFFDYTGLDFTGLDFDPINDGC